MIETLKVQGGRKPYLFSIPPNNGSWPFFVHPTSGHIYLANKLDKMSSSQFMVPFTVQDSNQKLAFMQLNVNIEPGNKNAPKFVTFDNNGYQMHVSITVTETDQVAKVILKLSKRITLTFCRFWLKTRIRMMFWNTPLLIMKKTRG